MYKIFFYNFKCVWRTLSTFMHVNTTPTYSSFVITHQILQIRMQQVYADSHRVCIDVQIDTMTTF